MSARNSGVLSTVNPSSIPRRVPYNARNNNTYSPHGDENVPMQPRAVQSARPLQPNKSSTIKKKPLPATAKKVARRSLMSSLSSASTDYTSMPSLQFLIKELQRKDLEWTTQISLLGKLRILINAGDFTSSNHSVMLLEDLTTTLAQLLTTMRSQVVKDVCVAIQDLASRLRELFSPFAPNVIPELLRFACSATAKHLEACTQHTLVVIFQHCHLVQLVDLFCNPELTYIQRGNCGDFLVKLIIKEWSYDELDRQGTAIERRIGELSNDIFSNATTHKHCRWAAYQFIHIKPTRSQALLNSLSEEDKKMITVEFPDFESKMQELAHIADDTPLERVDTSTPTTTSTDVAPKIDTPNPAPVAPAPPTDKAAATQKETKIPSLTHKPKKTTVAPLAPRPSTESPAVQPMAKPSPSIAQTPVHEHDQESSRLKELARWKLHQLEEQDQERRARLSIDETVTMSAIPPHLPKVPSLPLGEAKKQTPAAVKKYRALKSRQQLYMSPSLRDSLPIAAEEEKREIESLLSVEPNPSKEAVAPVVTSNKPVPQTPEKTASTPLKQANTTPTQSPNPRNYLRTPESVRHEMPQTPEICKSVSKLSQVLTSDLKATKKQLNSPEVNLFGAQPVDDAPAVDSNPLSAASPIAPSPNFAMPSARTGIKRFTAIANLRTSDIDFTSRSPNGQSSSAPPLERKTESNASSVTEDSHQLEESLKEMIDFHEDTLTHQRRHQRVLVTTKFVLGGLLALFVGFTVAAEPTVQQTLANANVSEKLLDSVHSLQAASALASNALVNEGHNLAKLPVLVAMQPEVPELAAKSFRVMKTTARLANVLSAPVVARLPAWEDLVLGVGIEQYIPETVAQVGTSLTRACYLSTFAPLRDILLTGEPHIAQDDHPSAVRVETLEQLETFYAEPVDLASSALDGELGEQGDGDLLDVDSETDRFPADADSESDRTQRDTDSVDSEASDVNVPVEIAKDDQLDVYVASADAEIEEENFAMTDATDTVESEVVHADLEPSVVESVLSNDATEHTQTTDISAMEHTQTTDISATEPTDEIEPEVVDDSNNESAIMFEAATSHGEEDSTVEPRVDVEQDTEAGDSVGAQIDEVIEPAEDATQPGSSIEPDVASFNTVATSTKSVDEPVVENLEEIRVEQGVEQAESAHVESPKRIQGRRKSTLMQIFEFQMFATCIIAAYFGTLFLFSRPEGTEAVQVEGDRQEDEASFDLMEDGDDVAVENKENIPVSPVFNYDQLNSLIDDTVASEPMSPLKLTAQSVSSLLKTPRQLLQGSKRTARSKTPKRNLDNVRFITGQNPAIIPASDEPTDLMQVRQSLRRSGRNTGQ